MLLDLFILFSFVTSPILSRVAQFETIPCNNSHRHIEAFQCHNGNGCFGILDLCNGIVDCADGSDENLCHFSNKSNTLQSVNKISYRNKRQSTCSSIQWQCRDGNCISFDGKCDGAVDCPDGSDETHTLCRNMRCQTNWFRCTYGACVDGTAPCNGVSECADNSDELLPRCRNLTMEVKGQFKCQDGSLIPASDSCDGNPDCPDASDETVAACADKSCPSHLFQCAYGACVDQGADCNGVKDCADGSDENEELCNRILQPNRPTTTPQPKPGSCQLPPYPDHGTYEATNVPNARPGLILDNFVLTVSCQQGYGIVEPDESIDGNTTQKVYCIQGTWYQKMPQCVRFCRLDPNPSVDYLCPVQESNGFKACQRYVAPGTSVNPICRSPNYYSSETLKYMKCISGSWDYVAICKPECGRVTPAGTQLLAGGSLAKRGELPWHAGIYSKNTVPYKQICGGSLVYNNIVISAAHCFWDSVKKQLPASSFAVAVGKLHRPWIHKEDPDAQHSEIKDIKIPRLFDGSSANFQEDIAIIILATPFVYHTYVRPVCLNFDNNFSRRQLQQGKLGKVAGWGLTTAHGIAAQVLKVVELPYIDEEICINTFPASFREYVTGDKFCAGYTNGTAVCQGDSGGGLVFPDIELGDRKSVV